MIAMLSEKVTQNERLRNARKSHDRALACRNRALVE